MMKKRLGLVLAACVMTGTAAFAATLTFDGVPNYYADTLHITTPDFTASLPSVEIGFYTYNLNGAGPVVKSFCIDFYDAAPSTPQPYSAIALASAPQSYGLLNTAMGAGAATTIEKLWALNYNNALASPLIAAELQVAIWKAIAQSTLLSDGITHGSLTVGSGADPLETGANTLLANAASYSGPLPDLFAWSNEQAKGIYQDYIGVPDGGLTVVLLGMALTGLAAMSRRCPK